MSRHLERLDLRDHDGFERCVRHKATSFRALHLFLRGCERQLVNPVIALAIAHPADQLKSGRTSAPRLPQAVQVKRPSMSNNRTSSGQRSARSTARNHKTVLRKSIKLYCS